MYRMLVLIATLVLSVQAAYADVKIGILMPLTGAGSRYGQEQKVAVDMFLEKYSDLGGAAGLPSGVGHGRGRARAARGP